MRRRRRGAQAPAVPEPVAQSEAPTARPARTTSALAGASPTVEAAPAEEVVVISIGRIEVRAAPHPVAAAAPRAALARPKLSLDDYLAARDGGRR